MNRLIVNPGTPQAWEISLESGVTSLGRGEENDFCIEHPSVSSAHCQIIVNDSVVAIKDLGSVGGTYVGDTLVEESPLKPGQMIRLGDVQLHFESDTPVEISPAQPSAAAATSAPPVAFSTGPVNCRFHPRMPARFSCPQCGKAFCESCISMRGTAGGGKRMCRLCSVEVTPLQIELPEEEESPGFFAQLPKAFLYPFKRDGVILLVCGTILYFIIEFAAFVAKFAGMYGWAALLILTVFGGGYLVTYAQLIVSSSTLGDEALPDWPEISNLGDVIGPFFQLLGVALVSFAPAILLACVAIGGEQLWAGIALLPAMLAGCVYFPMAFLAFAMVGSVTAVNPIVVVPSILRIPKEYFITVVLFAVMLTVRWGVDQLLGPLSVSRMTTPSMFALFLIFAVRVVSSFIGLYLLIVNVRILGLLYLEKKSELGWFRK